MAHTRAQVLVTVSTRQPNTEQLADALLASLKLSQADHAAYRQANDGLDIRDQLIAEFRETGINHAALEYVGKGQYRGYVGMPKDIHQRLVELSKTDGQAPAEVASTMSAKQQELRAQGAQTRHQLELQLCKTEAKQQIVDGVVGKGGAQIAGAAVMRAAPVVPKLGPVAIGAPLALPAIVTVNEIVDVAIERQVESGMMAPPPPLTANETDTKTKPSVPDIGVLPTAGPLVPTSQPVTPGTTSAPEAPRGSPQGEPPQLEPQGQPPGNNPLGKLVGPATGAATTAAGIGADKMAEPSTVQGTEAVSKTDETKDTMTNAQVRQWYLERVGHIPELNIQWIAEGRSVEERAKAAWQIRHDARLESRAMMADPAEVELLRERDIAKHGHPDGPTFESLIEKAQQAGLEGDAVYEAIINGSYRTDTGVTKSLGL